MDYLASKKWYILGATGIFAAYLAGASLLKGCTADIRRIKVDFNELGLTQISSYTLVDINGNGLYDSQDMVEILRQTFDRKGNCIAPGKKENLRLEQLTSRELNLLGLPVKSIENKKE